MLSRLLILLVRGYQVTLGRALPDRCRFHPTCSAYAIGAIRINGALRGVLQAAWRLVRCGPWTAGGVDYPRPRRSGRAERRRVQEVVDG